MKLVFGFSKAKGFDVLSKIIEIEEKRPFSHDYMRLSEPTGVEVVFQATGLAVNLDSFDGFRTVETVVEEYEIELTGPQYLNVWHYILGKLGAPYSIMQLVRILIKKLTGIKLGNDGQSEICSELATQMCEFLHIEGHTDSSY